MLITIDETDPRPIYQQIVDEVRRAVVVGALAPDEPLPSVRQLAAELKLNPNTVQQAYRELERQGLVHARRGKGTFVADLGGGERAQERIALATSVAEGALREAHRNGLEVEELVEAIWRVAGEGAPATTGVKGTNP